VKLVISDAHEGIKAAVSKVLSATWQRCRVHFQRNIAAHAGKSGRRVVSAFIATAFAQDTAEAASAQWRAVADQIRPKVPKLATIMDGGGVKRSIQWIDRSRNEHDVLAYMSFPKEHRTKLPLDESDRASQRRDQAPHRCRRHLSQRRRHRPTCWGFAPRTER
jgi:transposase-like protein